MTDCRELAGVLRHQLRAQVEALTCLVQALAGEEEHLRRRDRAYRLRSLKAAVSRQVANEQNTETALHSGYLEGRLVSSVMGFAAGGLVAAIAGRGKHALTVGARCAGRILARKEAFGTVMVAVGPEGIPDDVVVFSLSRLAREHGRTESQVEEILRHGGYALFTLDAFVTLLDELERAVLDGTLDLPAAATHLLANTHGTAVAISTRGENRHALDGKSPLVPARPPRGPERGGVTAPRDKGDPDRRPDVGAGKEET